MTFRIKLYTSSDLLNQPWISDFTHMVNASYRVSHTTKLKFATTKTRLHTDSTLSEELGADGFTAVALVGDGKDQKIEVIGTASMKKWTDDGLWMSTENEHDANQVKDKNTAHNRCVDQILHQHACPGDYELAVVALPPDPQYRGRGIAGHLVKACEEEILRRNRVNGKDASSPVRIMIRVTKEDTGDYWLKQGFTVVGSKRCPKGFWDSLEEFIMWAMMRELSTI
ncbi:Acyl-CoA N-acyltransferase [Penicillium cf. griseofulvum]|uniref:Acyl-CoA N-acyltransferase n=1 Tax=Penicillium cf. griseofulvum TaxID=2972120 RepID=A0A9W9M426_9EURO|nr:Acyl-CoA N-acyltransferase [Penicillium cf. griseofulvum]KAJ5423079.1 Acyl-CoA N-acyltransferase [Penicillium cf. griseofulvum]KAJ5433701.1 Acyl-CoA N-acyltransferase [Penicillium cf. griseofulvum]